MTAGCYHQEQGRQPIEPITGLMSIRVTLQQLLIQSCPSLMSSDTSSEAFADMRLSALPRPPSAAYHVEPGFGHHRIRASTTTSINFMLQDKDGRLKTDHLRFSRRVRNTFLAIMASTWAFLVSLVMNPKRRRVMVVLLAMLVISLAAVFSFLAYYVPYVCKSSFASFSGAGSWPNVDVWGVEQHAMHMNLSHILPLSNFIDTAIEFRGPMNFSTGGQLIAQMQLPRMAFGFSKRHYMSQNLTAVILEPEIWADLWKRWIARSTHKNPPEHLLNDTIWDIETLIDIDMLGVRWSNIKLTKQMPWNGGLSAGLPAVKMSLANYKVVGGWKQPGMRLTLRYENAGIVGLNMGTLMFSVYSLYRRNVTTSQTVRLLDVDLQNFFFRPGTHNLTVQNEFLRSSQNSVKAAMQLGTNFVRNKTSILVIRDFASVFNGNYTVPWVDEVLGSMSYVVYLERRRSLTQMVLGSFKKFKDGFKAKVDQYMDFGDSTLPWSDNSTVPTDNPHSSADNDALDDLYNEMANSTNARPRKLPIS